MNELKIYTNYCLTCNEDDRVNKVKSFAKKHDLNFVMRRADLIPELRQQAKDFGTQMPFVELNGKTAKFLQLSPNPTIEDNILNDLL